MKSAVVITVLVAVLAALLLAFPATEAFLAAESAISNRFGNSGYGKFDRSYRGGWVVNGYPGLPVNVHSLGRVKPPGERPLSA